MSGAGFYRGQDRIEAKIGDVCLDPKSRVCRVRMLGGGLATVEYPEAIEPGVIARTFDVAALTLDENQSWGTSREHPDVNPRPDLEPGDPRTRRRSTA